MADLNLTQERPKITIQFTDEAGVDHAHSFEVLPLNKPRYEKAVVFMRRGRALGEDENVEELAPMLAEFCDALMRSTNGPVTMTSLWNDGVLPFEWMTRVAQHLQQQVVGDPPA